MSINITSNTGTGSIVPDSIFAYSYSEEVTSIDPSSSNGGTSQVTLSAVADSTSKFLINNLMQLTDTDSGSVDFQVKSVSINAGLVSITGDTTMARLNVEKTAGPVGGLPETPATLLDAINYYCGLVGITPAFDDAIDSDLSLVPVNFIGWTGNVWEHLKMLCSASSFSLVDNSPFEMYFANNELRFRPALSRRSDFSENKAEESTSINAFDASKSVVVTYYGTSYGIDKVFYEESNYSPDTPEENKFQSSLNDNFQVDAGKTITKRFKIDASLASINQPEPVIEITRVPPSPYADGGVGQYVVVGTDNLPVKPAQWTALGGKLTVALTENPNEVEVTMTAPEAYIMPTADSSSADTTPAPYKIGIESSGIADYPALWLTGTGVFFIKEDKTFLTGAPDNYTSNDVAATINNPFISDLHSLSNAGIAAAQAYCGPTVTVNKTLGNRGTFGTTIGLTERIDDAVFRYESVSYSPASVQLSGRMYTSINEFDENWIDTSFSTFNSSLTGLKFNELTVAPLTKGI